jgi:Rrf2 family protein
MGRKAETGVVSSESRTPDSGSSIAWTSWLVPTARLKGVLDSGAQFRYSSTEMANTRCQNGSSPFRVSEAANLGLHALAVIAAGPETIARTREIASRLKASAAHLAKVMVALEHAGLVAGTRGPAGGYRLTRPASRISLRQIYEAIEGPMQARACLCGEPVCEAGGCPLSRYFGKLNRDVIRTLGRARLTDLVKEFGGDNGK